MSSRFMDRVLTFMGFEEEPVDEGREQGEHITEESKGLPAKPKKNKGQVVSLHAQRQMRVTVVEPTSFDDVQGIADNLKNRRPVIINLEQAEPGLAKRVVDFVSGATYALDGSMQKVGKGIFLFVPSNVDIENEAVNQDKDKGIFAWMK
ncbi:cell division inhibitor SepF [Desulfoscipio geothermicus DSM 3669]|uniref:Cell division protein SepF n=2 Tax=Desulfoscipio geothermicus TaxID=39060 RepID=A0A1I6EAB2_9FIRM|nr:cell division protein SepF [Desulfoscipio geothermicus]SFR14428.1 cell division inhibitor SepF [Desulfoscipio geothermicus DSM 3669]